MHTLIEVVADDPDSLEQRLTSVETLCVAGAFPFASYELSDAGSIFLGLNLYNRSPVFMDFFDDY